MASNRLDDFPLFPLPLVIVPSEVVPLHIFEDRFRTMIELCLDEEREFGVIWLADNELKDVGCSARVIEVLERDDEGRMNILVRGAAPFRLIERSEEHAFPAGTVELLDDRPGDPDEKAGDQARERYADLLEQATDQRPDATALAELSSYEMAATVDIGHEAKQGLLELRSEPARMRLLARMLADGAKRLEVARQIAERAQGNGRVA